MRQTEGNFAKTWRMQEATAKFDQVIDDAIAVGQQIISRDGVDAVVVVSHAEYIALVERERPIPLSRFFRESPLAGADLDLSRIEERPILRRFPWENEG